MNCVSQDLGQVSAIIVIPATVLENNIRSLTRFVLDHNQLS